MRILLAWAAAAWSVRDVSTGVRGALVRAGHDVRDYRLDNRLELIGRAIPKELQTVPRLSQLATEGVLAEATYHHADLVLIVSGLYFHEIGLWLLQHYHIPTAVVLTESPYEDANQMRWLAPYPEVTVFTQERLSAQRYGWHYLPHAYDPLVHQPVTPDPDEVCDVLLVGTGWAERQRLLEAVDWTGIHLRVRGLWPEMTPTSSVFPHFIDGCVENADLPPAYAACKIALNPYRRDADAESLNPRAYELAACGVFQLSDARAESHEVFGEAIPTYRQAADLETQLRYYLTHEDERQRCADLARHRVQGHTFDARVAEMMTVLAPQALAAVG